MSIYTLSTVPLIQRLGDIATQVWFADDAATADGTRVWLSHECI